MRLRLDSFPWRSICSRSIKAPRARTALVVTLEGETLGKKNVEFPQHFPQPGWVEHDPEADLDERGRGRRRRHRGGRNPSRATSRRSGSRTSARPRCSGTAPPGSPIFNAIVWQDRRTAAECDRLKASGAEALVRDRTGLVIDAYFSGTKVAWILDHVEGARARAEKGELAFGTIDTFLVHRLTGGAVHVTDVTNASRTLLMDLAQARLGRRDARDSSACRARCCRRSWPAPGHIATTRASASCPTASRSRASPAISRPRSSGRRASPRATRSAPTARARSCS